MLILKKTTTFIKYINIYFNIDKLHQKPLFITSLYIVTKAFLNSINLLQLKFNHEIYKIPSSIFTNNNIAF